MALPGILVEACREKGAYRVIESAPRLEAWDVVIRCGPLHHRKPTTYFGLRRRRIAAERFDIKR